MAGVPTGFYTRFTFTQMIFVICLFGMSTIVSYLAVSWKLSQQWTPDIINSPNTVTSFMIQPIHSSNMSISIMSHAVFLNKDNSQQPVNGQEPLELKTDYTQKTDSQTNKNDHASNPDRHTSYHPEWGTINDPHLVITNASYDQTDFSLWWTEGDGSPLFINASKYDKDGKSGYESFVFCPIPKVGCSSWKQVMRRIKGIDAYLADDYWSLHHRIENGLEMDRIFRRHAINATEVIDVNAANEVLHYIDGRTNKSIYHAAFVRDSIERSLSAFLDKCVQSQWHSRYWCKPQNRRIIGRYSHFDIFVEAIIGKAKKPKSSFLQRYSFWGLDYHWLPQNWICDLYKFISRYHIYDADTVLDRKHFFLNIGGNKSWNAIGETGWFHHANRRRLHSSQQHNIFVIPKYKEYEYVDTVNDIRRQHPPGYRGYKAGDTLDISGSLLSENAAHAQNTRHKVYSYYRADLVAKLIVFYLDDYVLFKRKLPSWICAFINVEPVLKKLKHVNRLYKDWLDGTLDKAMLQQMEQKILFGANGTLTKRHFEIDGENLLSLGKTSIWNKDSSNSERRNRSERNMELSDDFRMSTKLKCFYDVLIRVDEADGTLFGVLRGVSLLLDVLSNVNETILPNDGEKLKDSVEEKSKILLNIMDIYLNQYIPNRLKAFNWFERAWNKILLCLDLEIVEGKMDFVKLYDQWHRENMEIFDQIIDNMVYSRDVPRNARYESPNAAQQKQHKAKLEKQAQRYTERRTANTSTQLHNF